MVFFEVTPTVLDRMFGWCNVHLVLVSFCTNERYTNLVRFWKFPAGLSGIRVCEVVNLSGGGVAWSSLWLQAFGVTNVPLGSKSMARAEVRNQTRRQGGWLERLG